MKNILILNGAARKNGSTAKLIDAFTEGAKSKGHSMESFYLQTMNINGCLGCNGCHNSSKGCENPCVQNDDMEQIYKAINKADVVVFASPVYFWNITGALKTATDRLYASCSNLGLKDFRKESVLIMTAGSIDYSSALNWYKGFETNLGWKNLGTVLGHEKIQEAKKLGMNI